MRRVKLTLAYDGTAYHGFQVQPNGVTVQAVTEEALGRLLREKVRLRAAGRTDAGVHAREQVVDFADSGDRPLETVVRGGNALLPPDVRILSAEEVPPGFDARRHALGKEYRYGLLNRPVASPFLSRYAWHIEKRLNLDAMREALAHVVGEHDFSAFRGQGCTAETTVRTVRRADLVSPAGREGEPELPGADAPPGPDRTERGGGRTGASAADPSLHFVVVSGDGFLKHMVRNLVGTLVEVGRGKIPPGGMRDILEGRDRTRAGPTAPALGLFLWRVFYPDSP